MNEIDELIAQLQGNTVEPDNKMDTTFTEFLSDLSKLTDVELNQVIDIMHDVGFTDEVCDQCNGDISQQADLVNKISVFKTRFRNLLKINSDMALVKAL